MWCKDIAISQDLVAYLVLDKNLKAQYILGVKVF